MEKVAQQCTYEDAQVLTNYDCAFPPRNEGYDTYIKTVMA